MSLLRGIADDLHLQEWLKKYIFPAEAKNVSAEFCRWGTRLACLEMMLGGVTTYVGSYGFALDRFKRSLEKSIGAFDVTHNFKLGAVWIFRLAKGSRSTSASRSLAPAASTVIPVKGGGQRRGEDFAGNGRFAK